MADERERRGARVRVRAAAHDEDGLPDEDCPALDPKSPLSLLGGMDEFCLVEKGGTAERSAAGADDDRDEAGIGNENVEIEAPSGITYTFKVGPGMIVADLLGRVAQRLHLMLHCDSCVERRCCCCCY